MPHVGRLRYLEAIPRPAERPRGTLVLLHAFPLNARMWERQLAIADRGWRVIAPHLRGFGDPHLDMGTGVFSGVDDYAGDVIDLLDALHIDEAVVAGLSMGGYVAFAMLRHAARYVSGLILADTRAEADTPEGLEARKRLLQTAAEGGPSAVADAMLPKLLGDTTRSTRPEVVDQVRTLALASSTAAIEGAIRALMTRPDSTPLLSTIHVPTLVLVGDEDTVTPRAAADELHRRIAGSELVVLPRAGHLSNLETPAAFDAAITAFLDHRV